MSTSNGCREEGEEKKRELDVHEERGGEENGGCQEKGEGEKKSTLVETF